MTACVPCRQFFRPKKNGVIVEEWANDRPYKLWAADALECGGCGAVIVTGFGRLPIAEHYQKDYMATRDLLGAHGPLIRIGDAP